MYDTYLSDQQNHDCSVECKNCQTEISGLSIVYKDTEFMFCDTRCKESYLRNISYSNHKFKLTVEQIVEAIFAPIGERKTKSRSVQSREFNLIHAWQSGQFNPDNNKNYTAPQIVKEMTYPVRDLIRNIIKSMTSEDYLHFVYLCLQKIKYEADSVRILSELDIEVSHQLLNRFPAETIYRMSEIYYLDSADEIFIQFQEAFQNSLYWEKATFRQIDWLINSLELLNNIDTQTAIQQTKDVLLHINDTNYLHDTSSLGYQQVDLQNFHEFYHILFHLRLRLSMSEELTAMERIQHYRQEIGLPHVYSASIIERLSSWENNLHKALSLLPHLSIELDETVFPPQYFDIVIEHLLAIIQYVDKRDNFSDSLLHLFFDTLHQIDDNVSEWEFELMKTLYLILRKKDIIGRLSSLPAFDRWLETSKHTSIDGGYDPIKSEEELHEILKNTNFGEKLVRRDNV